MFCDDNRSPCKFIVPTGSRTDWSRSGEGSYRGALIEGLTGGRRCAAIGAVIGAGTGAAIANYGKMLDRPLAQSSRCWSDCPDGKSGAALFRAR